MSNYIHSLAQIIAQLPTITEQTPVLNFQHQFVADQEGFLPQWSDVARIDGVKQAVGELNWLFSDRPSLMDLHPTGCHHRDGLAVYEDLNITNELTEADRHNRVMVKFIEAGLEIKSIEDVRQAYIDNGMMAKHLTLDKCIEESGIGSTETIPVVGAGETGQNHGMFFSSVAPNGVFFFQHPSMMPDAALTLEENLIQGRLGYTPKQTTLSFVKLPIPSDKRLEYFFNEFECNDEVAVNVVKALVEGKSFAETPGLDVYMDDAMFESSGSSGAIKHVLNIVECPEFHLHAKLHLSNLFPITEFSYEVLPYIIYARQVSDSLNALYQSFTLDVNAIILDEEEVDLVNTVLDEHQFSVPSASFSLPEDFSFGDRPLTMDDLNLVGYHGN
ncbi:hypothetical protein [Vibrio phage phiKT1028]|nr:hypothetical protein [Vibrio phage phiKT1028]